MFLNKDELENIKILIKFGIIDLDITEVENVELSNVEYHAALTILQYYSDEVGDLNSVMSNLNNNAYLDELDRGIINKLLNNIGKISSTDSVSIRGDRGTIDIFDDRVYAVLKTRGTETLRYERYKNYYLFTIGDKEVIDCEARYFIDNYKFGTKFRKGARR